MGGGVEAEQSGHINKGCCTSTHDILMSYLINTIFYFYSTIKIVVTVILGGEVNVREAFCAALNILNAIFSANFTM